MNNLISDVTINYVFNELHHFKKANRMLQSNLDYFMTTEIIMNKNKKIGIILISVVVILVFVAVLSSDKPSLPIGSENLSIEIPIEYSNDVEFSSNSPVIGSSEAPVTILSFSDYQCIGCKTWYENEFPEISDKLIQTGKANIIFLDSVLVGSDSSLISQASFCANEQGKYQEYQKILFRSPSRT